VIMWFATFFGVRWYSNYINYNKIVLDYEKSTTEIVNTTMVVDVDYVDDVDDEGKKQRKKKGFLQKKGIES